MPVQRRLSAQAAQHGECGVKEVASAVWGTIEQRAARGSAGLQNVASASSRPTILHPCVRYEQRPKFATRGKHTRFDLEDVHCLAEVCEHCEHSRRSPAVMMQRLAAAFAGALSSARSPARSLLEASVTSLLVRSMHPIALHAPPTRPAAGGHAAMNLCMHATPRRSRRQPAPAAGRRRTCWQVSPMRPCSLTISIRVPHLMHLTRANASLNKRDTFLG